MRTRSLLLGTLVAVCLVSAGCEDPGNDPVNPTTREQGEASGSDNNDKEGVLINGVRWATANVAEPGTFAAEPEDYGMFYQWGKNVGWSAADPLVSSAGDTAWDPSHISGNVWTSFFDPCPDGWRVPTYMDMSTLTDGDNVVSVWKEQNGVAGRRFVDAQTENSIFIPAAGYRNNSDGTQANQGSNGHYWLSTAHVSTYAYFLGFNSASSNPSIDNNFGYGFSVRCVRR